jgi:hypothetical protein
VSKDVRVKLVKAFDEIFECVNIINLGKIMFAILSYVKHVKQFVYTQDASKNKNKYIRYLFKGLWI